MTKNWVFIILYLMFIALGTFMVSMYTEAEKKVEFLRELRTEIETDHLKLLSATVVANRGDGTNAIIHKTPLYEEQFIDGEETANIYIYKLVEVGKSYNHSLAIILNNLNITDPLLSKNEDDYSTIEATFKFNQTITIGQTTKQVFDETLVTLYDDTSKLLLFNFDAIKGTTPISFESIHITYKDTNNIRRDLVTLYNSNIISQIPDKFDDSHNRDIKAVDTNNIYFLDDETIKDVESNTDLFYDRTYVTRFSGMNKLYLKNIGIVLLVVLPLTYFIFFHGEVYRRYKTKRQAKKELEREAIEQFKKNKEEEKV